MNNNILGIPSLSQLRPKYYSFCARQRQTKTKVELSLQEWYDWWVDTGKLHLRGHEPDDYCMARIDRDKGYSLDNIQCITNKLKSSILNPNKIHAMIDNQLYYRAKNGLFLKYQTGKKKEMNSQQTIDQLRKEIQLLKSALMQQEELRAENKSLKIKLKEHEYKILTLQEKHKKQEVLLKPPSVEMILRAVDAIEVKSSEPEFYRKNSKGVWVTAALKGPKK